MVTRYEEILKILEESKLKIREFDVEMAKHSEEYDRAGIARHTLWEYMDRLEKEKDDIFKE